MNDRLAEFLVSAALAVSIGLALNWFFEYPAPYFFLGVALVLTWKAVRNMHKDYQEQRDVEAKEETK